jgi:SNF2 family DNA or RNA helicase
MKYTPWQHQVDGKQKILTHKNYALFFDMGTGKSATVIHALNEIYQQTKHCRVLIVCPKSVINVWPFQFQEHSEVKFDVVAERKGSVTQKAKLIQKRINSKTAIVLNYEAIWRAPMNTLIKTTKWDAIVLDESHRISAPGSKVSWFCKDLKSEYKILLTGTPLSNPLSIYGQYRFLNPLIFGKSFNVFKTRYAIEINCGTFKKVVGYQNEDELNQRIYSCAMRVKKSEVINLPPVTHIDLLCELPKSTLQLYKEFEEDMYAQWNAKKITASNALVKMLRLQQIAGGYMKYDDGFGEHIETGKMDVLKDLLEDLPEDEPIVIFCRFTNEIQRIKEIKNRTWAELSGSKDQLHEWQNAIFNSIVIQIQSGGVGIDLTRACYCIYYSTGYNLIEYEQSLARVDRPGQTKPVTIYHIIAENTIDQKICKALMNKKQTVEDILTIV